MALTYATDIYAGDGSETEFDLTFEFISRDHVTVVIINDSDGAETALTVIETGTPVGNEYRWENDTRIKVGTAPASDQKIRIRRDTPEDQQLVPWADGSYLLSEDLNTSDLQWLYGLQELQDSFRLLQSTAIKYYGAIDLTANQPPSSPTAGDFYINTGAGVVVAGWTGIEGDTVSGSEQVIYNGIINEWQIFDTPAGQTGVLSVAGNAPVAVDDTDVQRPVVSVNPATGAAAGSMSAADKAKLDGLPADAEANVNADWNAASGDAEILNKPAIPAAQVNSDWDATSGVAEILNKPVVLPEAPSNGKTYGRKDAAWSEVEPGGVTQIVAGNNVTISPSGGTGVVTVNSTGGGGTGTPTSTNIYGTAKAAGSVDFNGTKLSGFGFTSQLNSAGNYTITFDTPRTDINYQITGLTFWNTNGFKTRLNISGKTTTGFGVIFFQSNTAETSTPGSFDFAVHDEEPAAVALTTDGDVINYNGASAWGDVRSTGELRAGLNISSTVRNGLGDYTITFATPMPSDNYSVVVSPSEGGGSGLSNCMTRIDKKTPFGFRVIAFTFNNAAEDKRFSFAVFSSNALPPKGGTGADAWAMCNGVGTFNSSYNFASIVRTSLGTYSLTFTTPMPTADYAVGACSDDAYSNLICTGKTNTGFVMQVATPTASGLQDGNFSIVVHATNATLPLSFTSEQIESAINNPGASAWGVVGGSGALLNGLNVTTVNTGTGTYRATFITPMPSDLYSVVGSCATQASLAFSSYNRTSTGFDFAISTPTANINANTAFAVFSTNALPPVGGTGADAWLESQGTVANGPSPINASFNISSVTRTGPGTYGVQFTTPMPTDKYAITGSCMGQLSMNYNITFTNIETYGFAVIIRNCADNSATDSRFSAVVHATNATLPATLTREMLVLKAGDTMTGGLVVPSLSNVSGNLPIQRASIADSQTHSFQFSDTTSNWYTFNPIPDWCNHVRYNISVVLSANANTTNGGFYLRLGDAAGQLLQPDYSGSGLSASVLRNGGAEVRYADPLFLVASSTVTVYYDYVMDFYIYNRGINSGEGFYMYGRGNGSQTLSSPIQAVTSQAAMIVQNIIPSAGKTRMPDRMGCLLFGGSTAGGANSAQVQQTFLTDGPVGAQADLGPTPTPI